MQTHRSREGFDTRALAAAGCLLCSRVLEVSLWDADCMALPIEAPSVVGAHEGGVCWFYPALRQRRQPGQHGKCKFT